MNYLLDTNVFSELMGGNTTAIDFLGIDDTTGICVITLGEIIYGLERMPVSARRARLERALETLLASMAPPVSINSVVAMQYGRIKARLASAGRPLPENDLWIAAAAIDTGSTLITRDAHFQWIEGLMVVT